MSHPLTLRVIGKLQDNWQKQAIDQYLTRLSAFSRFEIIELNEGHEGSAKPNLKKTRTHEAESLLKGIPTEAYVVALDEAGKTLTSTDFADLLGMLTSEHGSVIFMIGGSWGLDASVLRRANLVLSLGKMTFPHALARILLLEQVYRAFMIQTGRPYHK